MDAAMNTALLLGLALGILYKTYAPYRTKLAAGTVKSFETTYIWTAIAAFVGSMMTAFLMFPEAATIWAEGWPFGTGYFAIFAFGFFYVSVMSLLAERATRRADQRAPQPLPDDVQI